MLKKPKFRSLYVNFLVISVPLTLVFFISITLLLEWFVYSYSYSGLQSALSEQIVDHSSSLAEPLRDLNIDQIEKTVRSIVADPAISFIELRDTSGKIISNFGQVPNTEELLVSKSIVYAEKDSTTSIGTLRIGATDQQILSETFYRMEYSGFLVLILIISVAISAYIAQRFSIGIALQRLLQSINKTEKDGKPILVKWDSNDEIGQLVDAYNDMQIRQQKYERDLQSNSAEISETIETLKYEISEKIEMAEALQASEQRYRTLYDDNPLILLTVSKDFIIESANSYGSSLLGYESDELVGESILTIFHQEDRESVVESLEHVLINHGQVLCWELRKTHKNGSIVWVRDTIRTIHGKSGSPSILIVSEDITEAHMLSEQLSHQASHDSLTNLVNRIEFEKRLMRALKLAKQEGTEHCLCYMDLDQFMIINDTYGHTAGDELLRQLGQLLNGKIRQRDILARLGGDEFGLLMEHCSLKNALNSAETLRKIIENYQFIWEDLRFNISVSIGLVPINNSSGSSTDILKAADAACYAAKNMGRNRVHIFAEDDADLAKHRQEMHWVTRIQQALEDNRFFLVAQIILPTVIDEKNQIHFEILLRMKDENDNVVMPGTFLPAAERYGLATKLDKWVVNDIFNKFEQNPNLISQPFSCSINLSGLSLADEDFLGFIEDKLIKTKIPANSICFEITETAAIANLNSAMKFIARLRELGCQFALDDFGSGLSSFAYLKTLPIDYIKIDGFFVKDIVSDVIDYTMVKSITEIGHEMGKLIIAEFVEDQDILEKLREIGVDYVQGFGIGKPQNIQHLLLDEFPHLH